MISNTEAFREEKQLGFSSNFNPCHSHPLPLLQVLYASAIAATRLRRRHALLPPPRPASFHSHIRSIQRRNGPLGFSYNFNSCISLFLFLCCTSHWHILAAATCDCRRTSCRRRARLLTDILKDDSNSNSVLFSSNLFPCLLIFAAFPN